MMSFYDRTRQILEAVRKLSKKQAILRNVPSLEKSMVQAFRKQGQLFVTDFLRSQDAERAFPIREAQIDWLDPLFGRAESETLKLFAEPLEQHVSEMLQAGALHLASSLAIDYTFQLKNPRSVSYLQAHGADLVTHVINETTKGDIRGIVTYGVENGWSYQKTARAIQEKFNGYADGESWWNFDAPRPQKHVDSRAHLIAITEAGEAYEEGNFIVVGDLQAAGLQVQKRWSTMEDDRVSAGCLENEAQGWISADQPHLSGHMHPLRFPGCRCDELYQTV